MILVVEDNAIIAMQVEMDLEDAGHAVQGPVPRSGPAVDLAEREAPSLALVDVDLAGGDSGIDLVTDLFERFGVRSLFMTGQNTAVEATGGAALGVISKPFGPDIVERAVNAALAHIDHGTPLPPIGGVRWFEVTAV